MVTRFIVFLLALQAPLALAANPPLFRVTHAEQPGEILLAGTVHFLPDTTMASPEAFSRAYEKADRLVFELDMTQDMRSMAMQMLPLAQDEAGGTLAALLGKQKLAAMEKRTLVHGLPLEQLSAFEPWFVSLQLNAVLMTRIGMNPDSGVETVYVARAVEDGKPVSGLETVAEQVGYFDELPDSRQIVMLEQMIDEADGMETEMQEIIDAWKHGDDKALDAIMQASWQEAADFAEALVYRRNRNWAAQLEKELAKPGLVLVMVGAGHLVGEDSVPDLLEKKGYTVERL